MIIDDDGKKILEFGTGDILITAGWIDEDDIKKGLIVFANNENPMPIGEAECFPEPRKVNLNDYDVFMTFSKSESIDALINELQNAKREMLR